MALLPVADAVSRETGLLRSETVRIAIGLFDAAVILVVAFVFLEPGVPRWALVALAVSSAVVTPWVLGRSVESEGTGSA